MKTAAVIVAAGMSKRMGEFKPLKQLGDLTIIEHVIKTFKQAGVEKIVVVTGRNAKELQEHLSKWDVSFVHNKEYETTQMFDSAKLGLSAIKKKADYVFFTPGDIPLFQADTIKRLKNTKAPLAKPVYHRKGGHPLLIDGSLLDRICSYKGEGGMKGALASLEIPITYVEVEDQGILMDADTKEDFERVKSFYYSEI